MERDRVEFGRQTRDVSADRIREVYTLLFGELENGDGGELLRDRPELELRARPDGAPLFGFALP